jgi:hypothetical protein
LFKITALQTILSKFTTTPHHSALADPFLLPFDVGSVDGLVVDAVVVVAAVVAVFFVAFVADGGAADAVGGAVECDIVAVAVHSARFQGSWVNDMITN